MTNTFNVYCDESCHLENDHQKAMVLGVVWCSLVSLLPVPETVRIT